MTNPGCIASEPAITVTGTGDITLMVGRQILELTGISGAVTIDSALQEVYSGDTICKLSARQFYNPDAPEQAAS